MPISGLSIETGASNWDAMHHFYTIAFKALGYVLYYEKEKSVIGFKPKNGRPEFWLLIGSDKAKNESTLARVGRIHMVFNADSPEFVNNFYYSSVKMGGVCYSPPAARSDFGYPYYSAKVLDPLGNSIEVVYSKPPMCVC